jgi:RNA-directed DNA polymerase
MKVQYWEEMANHSDPESCVAHREVWIEALTGDTGGPAIEPRVDAGFNLTEAADFQ